jgi:hypothetical protein
MSTLLARRQLTVIRLGFVRPTKLVRLVNRLPIEGRIAQISVVDSRRWVLGLEDLPLLLIPPRKLPAVAYHKPARGREGHFKQRDKYRPAFQGRE